ncbi:MAG TPA: ribonuclease P protein component [Patescibacteria group bacterium]|nr:ribonuclease P protein component [Patescibacteria group bacterium]
MLAKNNRLRTKKDYDLVFKKGQTYFSPFFNLKISLAARPTTRFGIIISTNISKKATARNLLKRQIRTIIRKNLANIKDNLDIIINTKPASLVLNYQELEQELLFLFNQAHIFKSLSK